MSRSFYGGRTIPELIVRELLHFLPATRIVVATSREPGDVSLVRLAARLGVRCSRGSQHDVLRRVLDAVRDDAADYVVRVCGDNPFLRATLVIKLIESVQQRGCDYASYILPDGTPAILSHFGLFAEIIRRTTLEQIEQNAFTLRHREHLTSRILDYSKDFDCNFLEIPSVLRDVSNLRLTVDTESDFEVAQDIYHEVVTAYGPHFSVLELVEIVRSRPDLQTKMAQQIAENEKR